MLGRFQHCVICAGDGAPDLLQAHGLDLPVDKYLVHSVTASLRDPLHAPRSAAVELGTGVAFSRLGQRVRVSCSGTPAGRRPGKSAAVMQQLYQALQRWFPAAANLSGGVQEWVGTACLSRDGLPLVGPAGLNGLWLNCGHGSAGWLLAQGAARLLADQIGGTASPLDGSAFDPSRRLRGTLRTDD